MLDSVSFSVEIKNNNYQQPVGAIRWIARPVEIEWVSGDSPDSVEKQESSW